jgi:AcrR family transcriptional regulator
MRPLKVDNDKLIDGLISVLRSKGYEGSSLNELASAVGLQKASLYHRFPEGKKEIALTVLEFVNLWVEKNIYNLISDKSILPEVRLLSVIENISNLYDSGENSCILSALSMDSSVSLFKQEIQKVMQLWIDAFTSLGIDFGFNNKVAKEKATLVLINIQGSLIVSKGLGSATFFSEVLKNIENMYKNT